MLIVTKKYNIGAGNMTNFIEQERTKYAGFSDIGTYISYLRYISLNQANVGTERAQLLSPHTLLQLDAATNTEARTSQQLIEVSIDTATLNGVLHIALEYREANTKTRIAFELANSDEATISNLRRILEKAQNRKPDVKMTIAELVSELETLSPRRHESETATIFTEPETTFLPYTVTVGENSVRFALIDCGLGVASVGNVVTNETYTGLHNDQDKFAHLDAVVAARLKAEAKIQAHLVLLGARGIRFTYVQITFASPVRQTIQAERPQQKPALQTTEGFALYAYFTLPEPNPNVDLEN